MPMRKTTTSLNYSVKNEKIALNGQLQPSEKVIDNILKFAASYRAEKTANGHYVEYILN